MRKSFTLIEILLVVTIVTLFTGYSIVNYNIFSQVKLLEKEANFLVDVLALTKGKAKAADISFICSGLEEFGVYQVEINSSSYNFKQCCRDINTKAITTCGAEIQAYDFSTSISKVSGASRVDFYPLTGNTTDSTIRIKNENSAKCLEISITAIGVITVGDAPFSC